jgi:zinc protease
MGCSSLNNESGSTADEDNRLSFKVNKKVLSNGLTILVVENFKLPIFSYYTYYKVGSKFESPGTTGSSHLLEHMMFKGAKKYGEGKFDQLVEGNGGQNNAYTTNDLTVYYENLPSQHFEIIADLEADRMQNLLLEKTSFEKERNVVLEERRMRYENSDKGKVYLEMMKTVFKGTPYGSSVIGEVEDLKTVSRDEVQKYFKTYYAPNNAVIVIVGAIDSDKAIETIEKKFAKIPATKDLKTIKANHLSKLGFDFRKDFKQKKKLKGTSPTPMFSLAFKGLKLGERDAFVLDILSSILGDGDSSYLNEYFVTSRKPRLSGIYAANYTLQDSGVFFLGGQLLPKKKLKNVEKELKNALRKSCDMAISERSVKKVLNQYFVSMLASLDKNAGIARFLGDREVYYGSHDFYKKEMKIYESITINELKSVCKKYLLTDENVFLSIWNKH